MIKIEDLYAKTNGGADLFKFYFPDFEPGKSSNLVKVRPDDDHPSASIFFKGGKWWIKDHGGGDNKARNMVNFVMEQEGLEFKDAVAFICRACNIVVDGEQKKGTNGAILTKTEPTKERRIIRRPSGKFTDDELAVLGPRDKDGKPCITQEICDQFNLIPLDGYINPCYDKSGKELDYSYKVEATDTYPIMFYDYGDWGKIYQPFGKVRFMYYGEKPEHFVFGCKLFLDAWQKALNGSYPHSVEPGRKKKKKEEDDGYEEEEKDERWENLTICSGPSDALNVYKAGHVVCWPNSESEPLHPSVIQKFKKLARNIYVLYDADATGIRNANQLALANLDIQVISLPADLGEWATGKRDEEGKMKMCKDIKDFCMYYKRGQIDPYKEFKYKLVKLAKSMKFWLMTEDENGVRKYEISNAHLYRFLSANGFHKMPTNSADAWEFVYEHNRVVEIIPEKAIVARVKEYLINFISENSEHYSVILENTIHRSKQINAESLKNLDTIQPNFDAFTADSEYYFFRNMVVQVTAEGIKKIQPDKCPYYVLKHKVIQHDLTLTKDLYSADYTADYNYAQELLAKNSPDTPNYLFIVDEIDKLTKENKIFAAGLLTDFDYVRFVWNTGIKSWREMEEAQRTGADLTPAEYRAIQKNFINKVTTLGYMLRKYKSRGLPKAVYCMETSVLEEEEGSHNGGTGKSLYLSSLNLLRKAEFLNGQSMKDNKWDFVFQRISFDTDIVNIDDLNSSIDMNRFLPDITGDLQVNPKNKDEFVIPYDRSPKFAFTSNHAIKRFDGSLRRRIQFVSFSDYYHSENPDINLKGRSPRSEFGRDLLKDYTEADWNMFYNFQLQNVRTYMRLGLVEPDMPDIELRQKRAAIGEVFGDWADGWLETKCNADIDRNEAFANLTDYCNRLKIRNAVKLNLFTKKVKIWCEIRGYIYNPDWWMNTLSPSDQKRKLKRVTDDITKEKHEYFYIQAKETLSQAADGDPF